MPSSPAYTVAGLFAGIGGVELGLERSGGTAELLCEWWEPAQQVLGARWPDRQLHGDVQDLRALPHVDVVTAGFPCTDLSQAGRTKGITGENSGLVGEVFRLLRTARPTWLVLENVRNMLVLDAGQAMKYLVSELEELGYRWAYRLVDSRSFGVPQRRQRVILVASQTEDPRSILFADEAGEPTSERYFRTDAFGFYWTEGLRGLGWAQDAVPTLKGGSTVGIASPPAVWLRDAEPGRQIVTPTIEDAEVLQGFPRGWTDPASASTKNGPRWKLVGNAVTVGVSEWFGSRIAQPGEPLDVFRQYSGSRWPLAAWGEGGEVWEADVSMWPTDLPYQHLTDVLSTHEAPSLSARATAGFLSRAERGSLKFDPDFLADMAIHLRVQAGRAA